MPMSELKAKCAQETHRLLTYDGQFKSQHMTATSLASAGLINLKKNNDTVVCVWCLVQFRNFKQAIDASALHFAYSEHVCNFIKHYQRLNVPVAKSQGSDQPGGYLDLATVVRGNIQQIFKLISMQENSQLRPYSTNITMKLIFVSFKCYSFVVLDITG